MSREWVSSNPLYQDIIRVWRAGLLSVPPQMCQVCHDSPASTVTSMSPSFTDDSPVLAVCSDCFHPYV